MNEFFASLIVAMIFPGQDCRHTLVVDNAGSRMIQTTVSAPEQPGQWSLQIPPGLSKTVYWMAVCGSCRPHRDAEVRDLGGALIFESHSKKSRIYCDDTGCKEN